MHAIMAECVRARLNTKYMIPWQAPAIYTVYTYMYLTDQVDMW